MLSLWKFLSFIWRQLVMNLILNVEKKVFPGKYLRIAGCFYRVQERERSREWRKIRNSRTLIHLLSMWSKTWSVCSVGHRQSMPNQPPISPVPLLLAPGPSLASVLEGGWSETGPEAHRQILCGLGPQISSFPPPSPQACNPPTRLTQPPCRVEGSGAQGVRWLNPFLTAW